MAAAPFWLWLTSLSRKSIDGNEEIYINDGGTSKKTTAQAIADLADASGTAAALISTHEASTNVHSIAGTTGLQAALDSKSETYHTHDAAYAPVAKGVTNGDTHDHSGGDGAQIAYSELSGLPPLGSAALANTGDFESAGAVAAHEAGTGVHSIASITGLQTALNEKSETTHNHTGVYEPAGTVTTHAALTTTHGISTFGATLVDDADSATARTTLGLGTAATTEATAYATAAQGALADTAVQQDAAIISQASVISSIFFGAL